MTSRRSFFRGLATLVATVALAPEIAFSRKLDLPTVAIGEPVTACNSELYKRWFDLVAENNPLYFQGVVVLTVS